MCFVKKWAGKSKNRTAVYTAISWFLMVFHVKTATWKNKGKRPVHLMYRPFFRWWGEMDSDHRSNKATDLQSAPLSPIFRINKPSVNHENRPYRNFTAILVF